MQENWLELYNRYKNSKSATEDTEFNTFMELSEETSVKFDSQNAWKQVQGQLNVPEMSNSFLHQHWWKIAASVILIISSFLIFYQFNTEIPNKITIKADDHTQSIGLPDGSQVLLSKGATLEYLENFINREVKFTGLAYFDIQKNSTPFIIHTHNHSIKVVGTAFSVSSNSERIQVYVEEGIVQFNTAKTKNLIHVQEKLIYDIKKDHLAITKETDPNVLSWKTGKFIFKNTPFNEAVRHLEKYYNISFIDTEKFEQCNITAKFEQEELTKILEIMESILDARFVLSNSNIQTIGKGCN